jgi:hypothetical protein
VNESTDLVPLRPGGYEHWIRWDGKNLAAIQMATGWIPREHGRPTAEVDREWNLTLKVSPFEPDRVFVPVGSDIFVGEVGHISISAPFGPAVQRR